MLKRTLTQFRKINLHLLSLRQQLKLAKKVHLEIHQHRRLLLRERKKIGRIHLEVEMAIILVEAQSEIKLHLYKKNRVTFNMKTLKILIDRNLENILRTLNQGAK